MVGSIFFWCDWCCFHFAPFKNMENGKMHYARCIAFILFAEISENRPNSYEFTKGIKINGTNLYEIQLIYTIWLELEKPPINVRFIHEVVTRLQNRPKSKWIPRILHLPPKSIQYSDDQVRQVRKYIKKAEKICYSVSLGQFPGKTSLS